MRKIKLVKEGYSKIRYHNSWCNCGCGPCGCVCSCSCSGDPADSIAQVAPEDQIHVATTYGGDDHFKGGYILTFIQH